MIKNLLSIIIPSRGGQPHLQRTIDGLLDNAREDIEIIVVCDGIWPDPPIKEDDRVIVIHHGTQFNNLGMKQGIMRGIAVSHGEFILKTDEHCKFGDEYDVILKADCQENWVVIPRRWRLDEETWKLTTDIGDKRPPIDYMYLTYPYEKPFEKRCGLHGFKWDARTLERKDILIDDTMTMQGSCYFMHRSHWDNVIKEFNIERFGSFTMEAQEIANPTWFAGGRVIVNKKTWYAHVHKGKRGKRYLFSNAQYEDFGRQNEKGRLAGNQYVYAPEFPALLAKFWPVPGWPENWKEQIEIDKLKDYSTLGYKDDEWLKGLRK